MPNLQHSLPTATGAPLSLTKTDILSASQEGEISFVHNSEAKDYEIYFKDDKGEYFGFRNDSGVLKAYLFSGSPDYSSINLTESDYKYGTYSIKREGDNWVYSLNGKTYRFSSNNNASVSLNLNLFGTGSNLQGLAISKKEVQNYEVFTRVSSKLIYTATDAQYAPAVTLVQYRRVIGSNTPYQKRMSVQIGKKLGQEELKRGITLDYQHSPVLRYIAVNGEVAQSPINWIGEETVSEIPHTPNRSYLGSSEANNPYMELCYYNYKIGHALNPQSTSYSISFDQEGQPLVDNYGTAIELDNGVTQIPPDSSDMFQKR